jgi:hypothetical protein
MSGDNDLFDDDAKNFLTELLNKHKFDVALDEVDDDTVGYSSSNPSPNTTSLPSSPTTSIEDLEEDLETPEDFQAMSRHIDDIFLADELYEALINTPPENMPTQLADAIAEEESSHIDGVYNLIADVVTEQAATLPPTAAIKTLTDGTYVLDTNVNGIRLRVNFNTLEQAALALVYAKLKVINCIDRPERIRENALHSLVDVVTQYNLNVDEGIQKHRNNGIDIPKVIDDLLEQKNSSSNSKRRKI